MIKESLKVMVLNVPNIHGEALYFFQFTSIYWLQNAVIAEKPFGSLNIGVWGSIESLNTVGIHFRPTRVQS